MALVGASSVGTRRCELAPFGAHEYFFLHPCKTKCIVDYLYMLFMVSLFGFEPKPIIAYDTGRLD